MPLRWRAVAAALARLVGVARIVHGVHLPADIVGGWSFGILVGLVTVWSVERWFAVAGLGGGEETVAR